MKLLTKCEKCKKFAFMIDNVELKTQGVEVKSDKQMCRKCRKNIRLMLNK